MTENIHQAGLPLFSILVIVFVFSLCGCESYSSVPLSTNTLEDELAVPSEPVLRVMISELPDPELSSVEIHFDDGIDPDEASVLSVVLNPALIARRAARGISSAELLSAGLLPDPTLSFSTDVPAGGILAGSFIGYGLGLDWAVSALIDRSARRKSARLNGEAVDLDILWEESLIAAQSQALVYGDS